MKKAQMTKTMQELVNAITVRNHIYTLVNGPRTALISKAEEGQLRAFASQLDREVVDKSIAMMNDAKTAVAKPVTTQKDKVMAEARAVIKEEKAEAAAKSAESTKPKSATDLLEASSKKKDLFRRVDQ